MGKSVRHHRCMLSFARCRYLFNWINYMPEMSLKDFISAIVFTAFFFIIGIWFFKAWDQNDCYHMKSEIAQGYPVVPSQEEVRMCGSYQIKI